MSHENHKSGEKKEIQKKEPLQVPSSLICDSRPIDKQRPVSRFIKTVIETLKTNLKSKN